MPSGRLTIYTEEIAAEICERLAEGESLRSISRTEGMPSPGTIIGWVLRDREGFSKRYAQAKDVCMHVMAEDLVEIADDNTRDEIPIYDDAGEQIGTRPNGEFMNRSRLRVDTRKWLLSKLQAKKYGDKLDMNVGGQNGDNPVQQRLIVTWGDGT